MVALTNSKPQRLHHTDSTLTSTSTSSTPGSPPNRKPSTRAILSPTSEFDFAHFHGSRRIEQVSSTALVIIPACDAFTTSTSISSSSASTHVSTQLHDPTRVNVQLGSGLPSLLNLPLRTQSCMIGSIHDHPYHFRENFGRVFTP